MVCQVGTLYETALREHIMKTALILVGEAVAHRGYERSRLYDPGFTTEFRKGTDTVPEAGTAKAEAAESKETKPETGGKETERAERI